MRQRCSEKAYPKRRVIIIFVIMSSDLTPKLQIIIIIIIIIIVLQPSCKNLFQFLRYGNCRLLKYPPVTNNIVYECNEYSLLGSIMKIRSHDITLASIVFTGPPS